LYYTSSPLESDPLSLHDALPICHHGDLVGNAREADERRAELHALLRIAQRQLHCRLGDPHGAGCSLDARRLESLHQLLESLALEDRKSTRLNSSHQIISYAVFCL